MLPVFTKHVLTNLLLCSPWGRVRVSNSTKSGISHLLEHLSGHLKPVAPVRSILIGRIAQGLGFLCTEDQASHVQSSTV